MRNTYNQPPFAKLNKRKLHRLFLTASKNMEEDAKRKLSPIQIARVVLSLSWHGKKKMIMTSKDLEELLYLIEVMEKRK